MRLAFIIAILILIASCTHDPYHKITVVVPQTCDTINMSYRKDIQPILSLACYECHSDSVTQKGNLGYDVQNFSSLKHYLENGYRGDGIYGSEFVHLLEHAKLVPDMPPSYTLDTCSIAKVRSWIRDGADSN